MKYIIIGGSIAGLSAAKAIRESDFRTDITMLSEEKTRAYYRPMIPFLIDANEVDITFAGDPAEKYRISMIYEKAKGLDTQAKNVIANSGKKYHYDKLLIATGSRPVFPDIKGMKGEGVFPLRTMNDALSIKEYAKGKKNAVVLGGGFVGIKAATSLHHAGLKVTIVEKLDQILFGRMDRRGAQIISTVVKDSGITVINKDSISDIIRHAGSIRSVKLLSGKNVDADLLIVAAGTKPNVDFMEDAGIKINKGILINESLQTNVPDIYAAGDVVEYTDLSTGFSSLSALWTNAEEMGRIAGRNMAGAGLKYRGFLSVMNSTDIFSIPVTSLGLIEPEGKDYEIIVEDNIDSYRKLVFRGDILVGAIFIGEFVKAGIYTNLIKNRIAIGKLKEEAIKGNLSFIDFVRTTPVQTLTV